MSSGCRGCSEDLEHCHGTLIHHALCALECTEDCATPEAVHGFGIDCEAIGCACSVSNGTWAVS